MNLNQVTLPALDMAASTLFYRKLGLTQIVDTPHYARFICPEGNTTLSLALRELKTDKGDVTIYVGSKWLDNWVQELEAKGLKV